MASNLEQEIKEKLIQTLELKTAPEKVDDHAPLFVGGLGLDSVDALEVASMLSTHFHVEIPDKETAKTVLASIHSIAEYVRQQRPA
jgi:acyl carrier protein